MSPQFPGMNPFLENPQLWSEVHFGLISVLARSLNAVITPKYRAAVEKRVYSDTLLVGILICENRYRAFCCLYALEIENL